MRIVFIDNCCPSPYVHSDLITKPMGGTEATVLRVGDGLAKLGHEVIYEQHSADPTTSNPDAVVTLRNSADVAKSKEKYPKARHYLWLHDVVKPGHIQNSEIVETTLVCVSNWHASNTKLGHPSIALPKVVYNPVQDSLYTSRAPTDQNKLVFFSSPHKGLQETLQTFMALASRYPDLKLFVANPGYIQMNKLSLPSVIDVGPLPHASVIDHVRDAFCVLYDNKVFPETFGLVMAEANALGVPVLTHPIGAAREVLFHPSEADHSSIIDRFINWKNGSRPVVKGKDPFRMTNVIARWVRLLTG